MQSILKDMGVIEYEPRLINQMLEFTYRYVTDILDDAKVYSNHCNKKTIDTEDVQLAVQCKMDHSFTTPPPRDLLLDISRQKNGQSLPLIKPYTGPRLPPDRYCLSAPNYKLVSNKKKAHRIQIGLPMNQLTAGHRISLTPIQKHSNKVQISAPTQKPVGVSLGSMGNMTVINRPSPVAPIVRMQQGSGLLQSGSSSQGIVQVQAPQIISGQPLTTTTINTLKRKLDDDDYDQT